MLAGPWGLSLAYPVRLRLSHRPPGLPSAPSERLSAGGLLNKAEHHPLPLRVEPIPCLREPDAALGAERWVPFAGAPWRGHQTCDAGTLSASQNSVGDFTVGGRADACLPVERRRGIRRIVSKERGGRSRPVLFWPFETPVSPGSPMLLRFWAKVCLNPDVYPTTRSPP